MKAERIAELREGIFVDDDGVMVIRPDIERGPTRLAAGLVECLDEIEKLQPLAAFGELLLELTKGTIVEGTATIDANEAAGHAANVGLIQREEYDPNVHDNLDEGVYGWRPDGMIYYWGPDNDAT